MRTELKIALSRVAHRNTFIILAVYLLVVISLALLMIFIDEDLGSSVRRMNPFLIRISIFFFLIIYATEVEVGLCRKFLYSGWTREKLFKSYLTLLLLMSVGAYLVLLIGPTLILIFRPNASGYMMHFYSFDIFLSILSLSVFNLILSLWIKKVASVIALAYFVLPLILEMPLTLLNKTFKDDLILLLSPQSLASNLASHNIFVDPIYLYGATIGYILLFTLILKYQIKKMDF